MYPFVIRKCNRLSEEVGKIGELTMLGEPLLVQLTQWHLFHTISTREDVGSKTGSSPRELRFDRGPPRSFSIDVSQLVTRLSNVVRLFHIRMFFPRQDIVDKVSGHYTMKKLLIFPQEP